MRFEELFDDLAAQAAAAGERIMWDEAQEMARAENVSRTLLDRVTPGAHVRMHLCGEHVVEGSVSRVGVDVVMVTGASGPAWVVPEHALRRVRLVRPAPARLRDRVRFAALVRSLARDRAHVTLALDQGEVEHGRLIAAGRDHLEVGVERGERVLVAIGGVSCLGWRGVTSVNAGIE